MFICIHAIVIACSSSYRGILSRFNMPFNNSILLYMRAYYYDDDDDDGVVYFACKFVSFRIYSAA